MDSQAISSTSAVAAATQQPAARAPQGSSAQATATANTTAVATDGKAQDAKAVQVERDAAGANLGAVVDPWVPDPVLDDDAETSIAEMLGLDGMSDDAAAVTLYRLLGGR